MLSRQFTLLILAAFIIPYCTAQSGGYSLFRSFTAVDGLPSNNIYNCVEDNNGFLWVASENGISRFDGKNFQNFTTKDGLPDVDVLDVVKENNGRIWVNCFRQSPAWFDEKKNRFICATEDSNFRKIKGTAVMKLRTVPTGGVLYSNENGSWFFMDGKFSRLKYDDGYNIRLEALVIKRFDDSNFVSFYPIPYPLIYYVRNGKVADSVLLPETSHSSAFPSLFNNKFYNPERQSGVFKIYTIAQFDPLVMRKDSVTIGEPIFWQRFTGEYFCIISRTGKLFVFDDATLKLRFLFSGNYSTRSFYQDSKQNIWICTVDKGLLLFKKRQIETYAVPDNFDNTNFISLARAPNGTLFAGNFYGQVLETNGRSFIIHNLPSEDRTNWQRKIIVTQGKIFSFSEGGSYINFSRQILVTSLGGSTSKTGAVLNDSIIIEGVYDRLIKINTIAETRQSLPTLKKRTTCIGIAAGNMIYHGSTDGLYKYDYDNQRDVSLLKNHPLLQERIVAVCPTTDGYVWVATAGSGLLCMRNDSVIKVFSEDNGISNSGIKCLAAGRTGEIWLGTNSGISILRYKKSPLDFLQQELSINDGLSSNIINEMVFSNDTMYCATGKGICAIPGNISLDKFDIPVRLSGISVNGRDTSITDRYSLQYDQNNIELNFAGIELGGHFDHFLYRIDNAQWQKLKANLLNIQLNSGQHLIEVKAVDVNGNAGTKPLTIAFTISTPFWKAWWFWMVSAALIAFAIFAYLRKRERARRETALQTMLNQKKLTELELQALKSQINPHFIFNCLNSIKLLSHQQKHAEAEIYLDRFASLLRSALEQSSLQQITLQQEIDFIENYLELEKLRLPEKFSSRIEIGAGIDTHNLLIPSMLLQPHIENAVKHGIAGLKNRKGIITVRFYLENNQLITEVQDNGNGFNSSSKTSSATGIGIKNTERRSRLYQIESSMKDLHTIDVNLSGTLIRLKIPFQQP